MMLICPPHARVTSLRPDDSEDNPFWYMFKVQCTSCRETHANHVGVNRFVRTCLPCVVEHPDGLQGAYPRHYRK